MAVTAAALAVGYATYTLLRKSVSVASPSLQRALRLTKGDLGFINTAFSVSCGASKFLGALFIVPRSSGRIFAVGLLMTSLLNVAFASCTSVCALAAVWCLAGVVQGLSWPALSHVVPRRFAPATLGRVWSVVVTAGNLGYLVGPFLLLPLLTLHGWRGPVVGSACAAAAVSAGVTALLWDDTTDAAADGTPAGKDSAAATAATAATQQPGVLAQARNLSFWLIVVANCLAVFLLNGMASWTWLYLIDAHRASPARSAEMMLWNEVGGIVGSLACGAVSDALGGRRCLTALLFACVCFPGYWVFPSPLPDGTGGTGDSPLPAFASMYDARLRLALFAMGCGVNGPKTLLAIAVRDVVPRDAVGAAVGVVGLVGQAGAAASGYGLGRVLERHGWPRYLEVLHHCTAALAATLLAAVLVAPNAPKHTKQD